MIVDTPVWSLALRRSRANLNPQESILAYELGQLAGEGRALLLGSIRQELLSGIRDRNAFDRLRQYVSGFEDEALTVEDYEEAALSHNRCRSAGIAGSLADFQICAVALRHGLPIFTTDQDFGHYARQLPLTFHQPRRRS